VSSFISERIGRSFFAMHLRGSDKAGEDHTLTETNAQIIEHVQGLGGQEPILVISDDDRLVENCRAVFGKRLIATDAVRTINTTRIHHQNQVDRSNLGADIAIDTYLAAEAAHFVGNGRSNVAAFVPILGRSNNGRCTLINQSILLERHLLLHSS
jgi:hypothetical protein